MEASKTTKITQDELQKALKSLEETAELKEGSGDLMEGLFRLLALPEDQFVLVAPGVMQSYQQSLNNPSDKIGLVQSFNALGLKADDVEEAFVTLEKEIDKMSLSVAKRDFLKQIFASIATAVNDTEGISKRIVKIPIQLCAPGASVPQYAHQTDSGMDVFALDDIVVAPGETVLVPTGIKVALPPGYELQVRPKSGRALKTKLRVANTPGTIDQGYRDEIKVIIENVEPPIKDIKFEEVLDSEGKVDHLKVTSIQYGSNFYIGKGEKFAQLVLCEVPKAAFYTVENVSGIGEDRGGGFGSSSIYDKNDERFGTDLL